MESQPKNPEFRNNPENLHRCVLFSCKERVKTLSSKILNPRQNSIYPKRATKSLQQKIFQIFLPTRLDITCE